MVNTITADTLLHGIGYFTFLYPVTMSIIWVIGGLYFWWYRERKARTNNWPEVWPPVTILIPCHNEEISIATTCHALSKVNYPDLRVVFIDDASTDNTAQIIREWLRQEVPSFHLLRLTTNQGKAKALNCGLQVAVHTPITVVIDADTLITPDTLKWLIAPFIRQPRLGAVSGNPLVGNRENLLENLQTAEFASILGLIKRSQRSLGRMLTVSGCITAFCTDTLRQLGGFSSRSATEDIDITWAIQRNFYEVWFEPRAIAYIQVPKTIKEFWHQRCRWALGGWHLLRSHWDIFTHWRWRRLWPVYLDFVISYLWSFCLVIGTLLWLVTYLIPSKPAIGLTPIPAWYGSVISFVCLVQFGAALLANHRHDHKMYQSFFWIPWYPIFFFCIGALTVVWTSCRGLFGDLVTVGKWKSPARSSMQGSLDE
ncbi:glycosyl transferase, family 2 [Desulforamulus reducens MI-1]|uniref:Glycosyl transferase, family 2 n=1 Tax=Desulforamulus reducens (strain ATCC BAA-1160 / DSM 100696 / MI-1) TaxID=349161 RepID=A4J4W8_DESRM|nr:glycosyltransferase [Desulforamulus reducens]ABO50121.1 glycosyl transferase, family 2 [Desulforamulus reducens MI-1]